MTALRSPERPGRLSHPTLVDSEDSLKAGLRRSFALVLAAAVTILALATQYVLGRAAGRDQRQPATARLVVDQWAIVSKYLDALARKDLMGIVNLAPPGGEHSGPARLQLARYSGLQLDAAAVDIIDTSTGSVLVEVHGRNGGGVPATLTIRLGRVSRVR